MLLPRLVCAAALASVLVACSPAPEVSPTPSDSGVLLPSPSATAEQNPWDFYLDDGGLAGDAYRAALDAGDVETAELLSRIALVPQAVWLGAWRDEDVVGDEVDAVLTAAARQGKPAVIAIYAIPGLDCSIFQEGGLEEQNYLAWIRAFASGIHDRDVWVILEPDALGMMGDCEGQGDRAGMLRGAAEILDEAGARVYLDAGNSSWMSPEDMAARIEIVGTEHLAGFSTNVSNEYATDLERAWDDQIAAITGLHYVIDTSRNGNGSNGEWCNPQGRALGTPPQIVNDGFLDAYLWVKRPGESDGPCNGGPMPGYWWQQGALEIAGNSAPIEAP